jgi:hypothetical protein
VEAGDPRWRGTREQEKRRQLAKKFYVAFRRGEDDETRYARLGKRLSTTYREEEASAGLLTSNGQGNGWNNLIEKGLISAGDERRMQEVFMKPFEKLEEPKEAGGEARRRRRIQILEDYANGLREEPERLGGGRDPWQEPPGGLTVSSHNDRALQRVCKKCEECRASLYWPTDRCTRPFAYKHVSKLVRFTDVDWITIPAREEKKEKTEFWDAIEDWSEEEMVEDIFCDALDLLFFYPDRTEIQGLWQRDFLDEKISRKEKEEEEEDSFSQGSQATTAKFQDIEEEEFFFDALDTIDEEKKKNDDDDVFWDASDKKSKEWQEIVRSKYRWKRLEKKAPKFFFMPLKKDWIWPRPKKGWEEKMQLTKVKSRERGRDFNFILEGEVVNRCKNIGKKWQRRVLRQKLEKRAKHLVRRWLTWTRWNRNSFLKNLNSINKEDVFEDGQQGKQRQTWMDGKFFFHTPRFEDGFRGGQRHRASRPPSPTRSRFWQKISRRPRKATRRRRSRPTEVTDLDNKKRNKKRSEGEGAERHRPRRRPRAREKNGEVENAVVNTND